MKSFLILLLFPILLSSQSERDAKLSIRNNSKTFDNTISNTETQSKITHRNNNSNSNIGFDRDIPWYGIVNNYDPLNMNRWLMWGAPRYGFIDYSNSFYYDRFGLRQPMRIYNMKNGDKVTVNGTKNHYRFGMSYNSNSQLGVWVSMGNKVFVITELSFYINQDQSSFLPNLTMDQVIPWNDMRLDDIKNGGAFFLGCGLKLNKFGLYLQPGYGWENNNYQFFDELFILSNNGKYSFPNFNENYFTGKVGGVIDFKYLTLKMDYNPFRNNIGVGVGIIL